VAHPANYSGGIGGGGAISPGVKELGHAADHSPPSSGEVKEEWRYSSITPHIFTASCCIDYQGQAMLPSLYGELWSRGCDAMRSCR
jgi:hypothetical protein